MSMTLRDDDDMILRQLSLSCIYQKEDAYHSVAVLFE
eukprot:SAG25_NODE_946_length_4635_cov_4.212963_2_plen_37_part_00